MSPEICLAHKINKEMSQLCSFCPIVRTVFGFFRRLCSSIFVERMPWKIKNVSIILSGKHRLFKQIFFREKYR